MENLNYANYVITSITEVNFFEKKPELRQLRQLRITEAIFLKKNLNYVNYVITPITETIFCSKKLNYANLCNYANYGVTSFLFSKSELRQLRNYANYGGIFLAGKILNYANYVITPVTVAHF